MIVRWAVVSLLQARLRMLASSLAVAAAFTLVFMFRAVWEGETRQLATYLERAGADVWVMQAGVSNVHMASSFVGRAKRREVESVEGVRAAAAVLYLNSMVTFSGQRWFCYIVGIEPGQRLGAPWAMAEGRGQVQPGEVVVPGVLARVSGVGLGGSVKVGDRDLLVVGLSEETFSATNPVVFVHREDLADLLSLEGYDSYLLVQANEGTAPGELARRIEAEVDAVEAMTTEELVESDTALARQMGTQIIALMTGICAALATLLVGFTMYVHTARLGTELAVLKAMGFQRGHVYLAVVVQSSLVAASAFARALAGTAILASLTPGLATVVAVRLTPGAVLEVAGVGALVAIVASLLLARRVASVEPATVFRT